ncbi:hypothetical protein AVEN_233842-1 [Araneus ventricosus]|uniref:Uncharacterized protein n=1 Tax=Araneus ventricosus TaxID=182803 RepID=A0A4Y2H7S0_ARAVE|nr:hypothetical protein AVEN_233842-1 [Araneus ventricosus]
MQVLWTSRHCLYYFVVPNEFRPPHAGGAVLSPLALTRPCTLLGWAGPVWAFLRHASGRAFGPDGFGMHQSRRNRVSSLEPSGHRSRPYHKAIAAQ